MNNKPTRIVAGSKSIIDHFWTNSPIKIKNVEQEDNTFSDHSIIIVNRHMNITKSEEQYIMKREYSKIDFAEVNWKIQHSPIYWDILEEVDPNIISEKIIQLVKNELDEYAPMKKIKMMMQRSQPLRLFWTF